MKFFLALIAVLGLSYLSQAQTPTKQSSHVTFTEIGCSQLRISWTTGNGSGRVVWLQEGTGSTTTPVSNGFKYNADARFGRGQISKGKYCIYDGTDSSVIVSDIKTNQIYSVSIYEYSNTSSYNYLVTNGTNLKAVSNNAINVKFKVDDSYQCFQGNEFKYTNLTTTKLAGSPTYTWNMDDQDTLYTKDVTYSYKEGGIHRVTLSVKQGGCEASFTLEKDTTVVTWDLDFELDTGAKHDNDLIQCLSNNKFAFLNRSNPPDKPIYGLFDRTRSDWSTSTNASGSRFNFEFEANAVGAIDVTLVMGRQVRAGQAFCYDTLTKKVYIHKSNFDPDNIVCSDSIFDLNRTDSLLFELRQTNLSAVHWSFGDGDTSNGFNVKHRYDSTGIYRVTCFGLDSNGCEFTGKKKVRITDVVSVPNYSVTPWKLSQNPVVNDLHISGPDQYFSYQIISNTGKVITTSNSVNNDPIPVDHLTEGLYVIAINESILFRFIKLASD